MGVLSPPRSPEVTRALSIARELGAGHEIDGAPAVRHAVRVVVTLERYATATTQQAAGIIMHDTPYFVDDRAGLDARIRREVGDVAADVVASIEAEHRFMGSTEGTSEELAAHLRELVAQPDKMLLLATIADKITAFESIIGRSMKSGDVGGFWRQRRPLARRLVYFRQAHTITAGSLPEEMAATYDSLVTRLELEMTAAFAAVGTGI